MFPIGEIYALSCYNYKTVQTNILLEGKQLGPIEVK